MIHISPFSSEVRKQELDGLVSRVNVGVNHNRYKPSHFFSVQETAPRSFADKQGEGDPVEQPRRVQQVPGPNPGGEGSQE